MLQGVRYRTVIWLVGFYFSNAKPLQHLLELRFSLLSPHQSLTAKKKRVGKTQTGLVVQY